MIANIGANCKGRDAILVYRNRPADVGQADPDHGMQ
jgi:hypothetical protein